MEKKEGDGSLDHVSRELASCSLVILVIINYLKKVKIRTLRRAGKGY